MAELAMCFALYKYIQMYICIYMWAEPTRLLKYKSHCQQWPAALTCDDGRRMTVDNEQRTSNELKKNEHVPGWMGWVDGWLVNRDEGRDWSKTAERIINTISTHADGQSNSLTDVSTAQNLIKVLNLLTARRHWWSCAWRSAQWPPYASSALEQLGTWAPGRWTKYWPSKHPRPAKASFNPESSQGLSAKFMQTYARPSCAARPAFNLDETLSASRSVGGTAGRTWNQLKLIYGYF